MRFIKSFFNLQRKPQDDDSCGAKWKILQDDYMMGASMKDWDKEDSSGNHSLNGSDDNEPMDADVLSDDD